MIRVVQKGDFKSTMKFLNHVSRLRVDSILRKYGEVGVAALASATPKESGKTAESWSYKINRRNGSYALEFLNSHVNAGVNIAIILQYGHGTGTGGYVEGRDYINPAIQPVFDKIASDVWQEMTKT